MCVPVPIQIIVRPKPQQIVEQGDIIDLTVVATSDPLYQLSYKWIFKDTTYEVDQTPPLVSYDVTTKLTFINTTGFTDGEMQRIKGVYRREIYHQFQTEVVDIEVKVKGEPDGKYMIDR